MDELLKKLRDYSRFLELEDSILYWESFKSGCLLILLLNCTSSLYTGGIFSANTFSLSVGGLFILLIASIAVQNFLVGCSPICVFLLLFTLLLLPLDVEETTSKNYC